MLVTVVTPCLNPGARLMRCLDSVAAQSYADVEHVVVDGGSTDGTVELLEQRGVRFVSEPDRGQTDAIAKGFGLARGELLTWLNADDELDPSAAALAVSSGADWVYGNCVVVEGGRRSVWAPPRRYGPREVEAGEMIPQPGSFFTRAALEQAGGLDMSFDLAMDIDLWIRLVDAGVPAHYVPADLAVFEIHSASKTGHVARTDFILEHARALEKSGRRRAASAAIGRATAFGELPELPAWADRKLVDAARVAELGIERLRVRDPRGVLALLSPRVWREREVRARLVAGLRRALSRS
jgi:glycosyltransferase involved in cell wall biosynthesis